MSVEGSAETVEEGVIDPRRFGAAGDGETDDTSALQRAADAAAAVGATLSLKHLSYLVRELILRPGMAGIVGPGTLRGIARTDTGLIRSAPELADAPQRLVGVCLRDLTIEIAEARCGIELFGALECRIERCRVVASRDLHKGIWLRNACRRNTIRDNVVLAPTVGLNSLVCITVETDCGPGTAGYFRGEGGRVTYPDDTWGNLIDGNVIEGGTHGIALGGSSRNRVVNNLITGSRHRNINICPASRANIVAHNQLLEAGSSAVAMAYGACDNIVTDNQVASWTTTPDVDRDAIHAYVTSGGNHIRGNVIEGTFRYGVYLAVSARRNLVTGNRIRLEPHPDVADDWSAGLVIETDWPERPLPEGAHFSRRNFGSAPNGYRWAYGDSAYNQLTGNIVERASCGVYLAQLNGRQLHDNTVDGNLCLGDVQTALCLHADDAGAVHHNRFRFPRLAGEPLPVIGQVSVEWA